MKLHGAFAISNYNAVSVIILLFELYRLDNLLT